MRQKGDVRKIWNAEGLGLNGELLMILGGREKGDLNVLNELNSR